VLRQYRLAAELTQELLAERAGLSLRTIAYLEQDRRGTPRHDTLLRMATALGLSPQEQTIFLAVARGQESALPAAALPAHPEPAALAPSLHPLIGRQQALDRLEAHLQDDGPPLFLLTGEPGIGKTRLLREVARRAVTAGWTVLPGGCHRHGGQEPYAPLLEALQHHLAGQDPLSLRRTLEGCAWLVQLLPELAEGPIPPLPAHALPEDQQRRLMVGAVQRYLTNVAGHAGTLLLLDDLQWAGRDALDLMSGLLRSADRIPLRVVGAFRDTEVDAGHPLARLLADFAPAGLAQQEPLGPLSRQEAAQLLAALLPAAEDIDEGVRERVLQRAGGMPFFLVSCAQSVRGGTLGAESPDAVPWDLRQSLHQRVAVLGQGAQDLLGVMAVIGWVVDVALLVDAAGLPEDEVAAALDKACRARLLVERGRDGYQFVHDVIREVVEADLGAARRAVLHRRVAEALEHHPGAASAELLAYHYVRSDAQDQALRYLELAGDHAVSQHAHDAAETHYRELVDRLDRLDRVQDAARARVKLGEVLSRTGRYDAALQLLEQAARVFQAAGDAESLAWVTVEIGAAHGRRGTAGEGVTRMRTLLESLERSDSSMPLAAAYEAMGHLLHDAGDYQEALVASARAAELAGAFGDHRTAVLAEWNRVNSLAALSQIPAEDVFLLRRQALSRIEALGELDLLSRAHHNLAYVSAARGAFETGRTHIDSALAAAEQLGDPGELAFAIAIRGWLAFLGGDWRQARADLEEAAAMSGGLDRSWYAPYPLVWLAELCLAEGDRAAAAASGGEATALAERNGDLQALRWSSRVMAELEVLEGRPEAAVARLVPLLAGAGQEDNDVTALLPWLAWARLEQGQVDQAADTVELALTRARRDDARLVLVDGLRVQAMIALRREQWEAAERSLEEGLTMARSMRCPYAEARLLHLWGQKHAAGDGVRRGGNISAGRSADQRLAPALAIFRRLGARWDADRVEQDIAALARD